MAVLCAAACAVAAGAGGETRDGERKDGSAAGGRSKAVEVELGTLLAGRDGRQLLYRKADGALFCLEMGTETKKPVDGAAVKHTRFDTLRGGINWDGNRFLYQDGDTIRVVNDDGSDAKAVVDGANPHWWRDPETGVDHVVYNPDAHVIPWDGNGTGGGGTMRISVNGGTPEKIWPHTYDAGLSRDGTHIGASYKGAFIGNVETGRIVGNLPPDEQHCVGSMLADNSYRLLYERSTAHRAVVIADAKGKIVWRFDRVGSGEIFAEASPNHPEFCVVSSSANKALYLVHIPTKRYADLGVSLNTYGRVGGPWVEHGGKEGGTEDRR